MKNRVLILTVSAFMAGTVLTNCQSSAKKVENAEDKVQGAMIDLADAQKGLNKTRQDSISEYQKFKKESEEKIAAHDKSIAEFKARIATEKKEDKAKYEKKLAVLEQKNTDLKKKLADYKETGKEKWDAFRLEFSHDLDGLGQSLKGFFVKSK